MVFVEIEYTLTEKLPYITLDGQYINGVKCNDSVLRQYNDNEVTTNALNKILQDVANVVITTFSGCSKIMYFTKEPTKHTLLIRCFDWYKTFTLGTTS